MLGVRTIIPAHRGSMGRRWNTTCGRQVRCLWTPQRWSSSLPTTRDSSTCSLRSEPLRDFGVPCVLPETYFSPWVLQDFHVVRWIKSNPSARLSRTLAGRSRIDKPFIAVASRSRYGGNNRREYLANHVRLYRDSDGSFSQEAVEFLENHMEVADIRVGDQGTQDTPEDVEVDADFACLYLNACLLFGVMPKKEILECIRRDVAPALTESVEHLCSLLSALRLLGQFETVYPLQHMHGVQLDIFQTLQAAFTYAAQSAVDVESLTRRECVLLLDVFTLCHCSDSATGKEEAVQDSRKLGSACLEAYLRLAGEVEQGTGVSTAPEGLHNPHSGYETLIASAAARLLCCDATKQLALTLKGRETMKREIHRDLMHMRGNPWHMALAFNALSTIYMPHNSTEGDDVPPPPTPTSVPSSTDCVGTTKREDVWQAMDPVALQLRSYIRTVSPRDALLIMEAIVSNPAAIKRYETLGRTVWSLVSEEAVKAERMMASESEGDGDDEKVEATPPTLVLLSWETFFEALRADAKSVHSETKPDSTSVGLASSWIEAMGKCMSKWLLTHPHDTATVENVRFAVQYEN